MFRAPPVGAAAEVHQLRRGAEQVQRGVVRLARQLARHDDADRVGAPAAIIHPRLNLLPGHLPGQVVREAGGTAYRPNRSSGSSSDGEGLTSLR